MRSMASTGVFTRRAIVRIPNNTMAPAMTSGIRLPKTPEIAWTLTPTASRIGTEPIQNAAITTAPWTALPVPAATTANR